MIESGFGNKSVRGSSGVLVLGEPAFGAAPPAQLRAGPSRLRALWAGCAAMAGSARIIDRGVFGVGNGARFPR